MKVTSATVINCIDCDKVVVETDVSHPNDLGIMTFNAEVKPGRGEPWIRNNFGNVEVKFIDRRSERG
jgi:hypothetical protein